MKKFLLALAVSTPSVKGIYTALFLLILTSPILAQFEMKDNNTTLPVHKWEVGVDLKPLFRSDEAYNVLTKWHFTGRKALRFGVGTASLSKTSDSLWIEQDKSVNNQISFEYLQFALSNGKKMNWNITLGYQYEFKQGKIGIYSSTDLNWEKQSVHFVSPYKIQSGPQGAIPPFPGYQSVFFVYNSKAIYALIQSLGFKYSINNYLSCSFEASLIGQYVKFIYHTSENPYVDGGSFTSYTKWTIKGGYETHINFKPLMGLYLNYHF